MKKGAVKEERRCCTESRSVSQRPQLVDHSASVPHPPRHRRLGPGSVLRSEGRKRVRAACIVGALPTAEPSKAREVPIIFLLTDCWSLGLVLTKAPPPCHDCALPMRPFCYEVIWRLVQSDVILHNLHREPGALSLPFFCSLVLLTGSMAEDRGCVGGGSRLPLATRGSWAAAWHRSTRLSDTPLLQLAGPLASLADPRASEVVWFWKSLE